MGVNDNNVGKGKGEGGGGVGGKNHEAVDKEHVASSRGQESPISQQSFSSLPSLQGSQGSLNGAAGPGAADDSRPSPTFAGAYQKSKRRVEGRRGRSWWEWKAAEERRMLQQSGDEGDDELTSLESESLRRRAHQPFLPKIRENLPGPEGGGGRDAGYVVGGADGGGMVGGGGGGGAPGVQVGVAGGGARGPSGGGSGGSPGLRVTREDRADQPPLPHQPRRQPLLLQQHHFLPQQQQDQPRRAAAPELTGVSPSGVRTSDATHCPPPPSPAHSPHAHPADQPKKVTITSFTQPKLTVVAPRAGPPNPAADPRYTPTPVALVHAAPAQQLPPPGAEIKVPAPAGTVLHPLLAKGVPAPSAPPKDLVYADADERRAQRAQHRPQGKSPRRAEDQHLPQREPQHVIEEPADAVKSRQRETSSPARGKESRAPKRSSKGGDTGHGGDPKKESGDGDRFPSKGDPFLEDLSKAEPSKGHSSNPFNGDDEDAPLKPDDAKGSPPKGTSAKADHSKGSHSRDEPGRKEALSKESSRRPEASKSSQSRSLVPVSSPSVFVTPGSGRPPVVSPWQSSSGLPALHGPSKGFPQQQQQQGAAGSLVWVNQPGGGSKLEWMPFPALATIKTTPALPAHDDLERQKYYESVSGAAPKGRGDPGGGGGGGGGGAAAAATSERVTRAASDVPRASESARAQQSPRAAAQSSPSAHVPAGVLKTQHPSSSPKNGISSAPELRSEGRFADGEEGTVLTVAGRQSGQVVRIRVRPEVHAYLTGLPTAYVAASINAATASSSGRRGSHQDSQSSSGSALTGGSDGGGEGSTGYHEHDYEEVVDEYTLLRRAVDEHDPDAMQLLAAAEAAINPDIPAHPHDPEGGGGSEYPYLREMKERLLLSRDPPLASMDESSPHDAADNQVLEVHHTPVGTVVKLNADGYGSHTSPTHRAESFYTGTLESRRGLEYYPKNAKTSTFITLSLLYATLLVVVCLGFVLSEVLTHNVPLYYYEAFFTYLYGISILFLLYVFCYLLSGSARERKPKKPQVFMGVLQKVRQPEGVPDGSPTQEKLTSSSSCSKPRKHKTSDNEHSHGSFFLRIGAIAFGLGTMIYNGLEFGVFFEIPTSSPCYQILRGVNPLLQLVFTFMQMYFVFMNARLNIHKFKFLARFGLMHIVATNLCVWVRTLVRESLKEINEFKVSQGQRGEDYMILEGIRRALANRGLLAPNRYLYNLDEFVEMQEINETLQQESSWVTEEDIVNRTCGRVEIMGSIVSDSAPYLYPFIVEYSLIGASVLYIMWKHIGRNPRFVYDPEVAGDGMSVVSRRCHSRVDCVGASKGLFCGLLVLVASLICLILFFVLVNRDELKMLAIYLADCSHCGIMFFSIIAMFIGFFRVRQLKFHGEREEELDDILLMVSAFGLFAYAVFSAVAGSLSAYTKEPNLLVMVTGILSVLQVIIQMVFIKDTQRRQVSLPEHERTKPGRQVVTFLLICNLTMWVIYTFETQKVEANPVQLEFFGDLPWTILLRCTLPLAIFHRFHSTVVLAAIWKNSYKTRIE
ncbi:proton channel OtopLc isoform X5 [Penaeus vannamei]|uniref:proton channel OtopLc isoform X5 n=1 Tax=Penaeus vannamei TaxID=6689 RepID=UPI00387F769D